MTAGAQHSPGPAGSSDAEALRTEAASAKERGIWHDPCSSATGWMNACLHPLRLFFANFRPANSSTSALVWEVGSHLCVAWLELVLKEVMGLQSGPEETDPARL